MPDVGLGWKLWLKLEFNSYQPVAACWQGSIYHSRRAHSTHTQSVVG
jgi:hypothetical protein